MRKLEYNKELGKFTLYPNNGETIEIVFDSFGSDWKLNPSKYENSIKESLNTIFEKRTESNTWFKDKKYKRSDADWGVDPFQNNLWLDTDTDEIVYKQYECTSVKWHDIRQEYMFTINSLNSGKKQ